MGDVSYSFVERRQAQLEEEALGEEIYEGFEDFQEELDAYVPPSIEVPDPFVGYPDDMIVGYMGRVYYDDITGIPVGGRFVLEDDITEEQMQYIIDTFDLDPSD